MKDKNLQANSFQNLKESFLCYKNNAGDISYVACFGKTFLDPQSQDYQNAKMISEFLVGKGLGVIHGGYSGIMEAASKGAQKAIANDPDKNHYWNIGVPMKTFDQELARSAKINLPAAVDISDRKKALIEFCDLCLVFATGGVGTLLESIEIIHNNQIAQKFGGKIRPIIFFQGNWQNIMDNIYQNLDLNHQSRADQYVHFVNSVEELKSLLTKIKI